MKLAESVLTGSGIEVEHIGLGEVLGWFAPEK